MSEKERRDDEMKEWNEGVAGPSDSFHLLKAQLLALKGPLKGHGLFKTQSCTVCVWTYCLTLPCTSGLQTSRMQSGQLCGSLVLSPEHSMEQKPHVQTGVMDACLVTQSFLMKVKEIQCPPLILAPLINMSKGGCENKSAFVYPFDLSLKKFTKFQPIIEVKQLKVGRKSHCEITVFLQ